MGETRQRMSSHSFPILGQITLRDAGPQLPVGMAHCDIADDCADPLGSLGHHNAATHRCSWLQHLRRFHDVYGTLERRNSPFRSPGSSGCPGAARSGHEHAALCRGIGDLSSHVPRRLVLSHAEINRMTNSSRPRPVQHRPRRCCPDAYEISARFERNRCRIVSPNSSKPACAR
jgi:hypothetical protein